MRYVVTTVLVGIVRKWPYKEEILFKGPIYTHMLEKILYTCQRGRDAFNFPIPKDPQLSI